MSPVVITIIGVLVGCCILAWAGFVIYARIRRPQKRDASVMHRWVPLDIKNGSQEKEDLVGEQDQHVEFDVHSKVQQNGHHSESKHNLL